VVRGVAAAAALVVLAVCLVLATRSGPVGPAERAQRLDAQLRCPVCEGLSVADSPSSTARAMAADVAQRVAAGQSDEEIRQYYVDRYGPGILLAPSGVPGSVAVGLPLAVSAAAAAGLAVALARRRGGRARPAAAEDEELVARLRAAAAGEERAP
jgi:cytochrome c-type biogenesis protein CcmH